MHRTKSGTPATSQSTHQGTDHLYLHRTRRTPPKVPIATHRFIKVSVGKKTINRDSFKKNMGILGLHCAQEFSEHLFNAFDLDNDDLVLSPWWRSPLTTLSSTCRSWRQDQTGWKPWFLSRWSPKSTAALSPLRISAPFWLISSRAGRA